ncbi:SDR family NAD(P)-dependent oxidoreductase [Paenactinomyces guangxiensis]|uniref:SDR family oxidoreductase n=1 Tax=Paenactinomyces guangxiensis TaxID=1490290 RepID=A0A7W1WT56_9BACL|nr:SDR family oxidoreductase [Paenactinomyces guangxiensis]MBA4495524.1 SDR family oxidoreductase [Paenactinomyces guangxiensis]MBH8592782.1 SDR family oxidoreductase [Paenactinomyces guangxiensis]
MQKTALITGASSGIGEAFAWQLAKKMDIVILVARREDRLKKMAERITATGGRARILAADLTDRAGLQQVVNYIEENRIDLLVNCAGTGLYGQVSRTDPEEEQQMIQLNVNALVRLTRAVLPQMLERNEGGIIQAGSILSFYPSPYMSAYAATKSFVLSYSEALAAELRQTGVKVSVLCPGSTESEFAARAGFKQSRTSSAEQVARIAIKGYEKGITVITPGFFNRLMSQLPRFLPRRLLTRIMARLFHNRN